MIVYVLQRLLGLVPVLFGITVVIFLTMKLIPGDVARALLGPMATDQSLAQLRHALGLDQAIHVQYVKWLWRALHGDLGLSPIVHKPVVDRAAMGASLVIGNMPPLWLGLVLIVFFAINLRWLPSLGMYSSRGPGGFEDLLLHLIMPAVATAAAPGAIIARMTRASLLEILGQDYIKVARSKGLSERAVLWLHALRVAWPPILTISGLQLGYLLGGAVFTEEVFGWPGLGRQLVSSVIARDVQVVQGAALFIAISFVLVNLVVDLLNLYLDPRARPA